MPYYLKTIDDFTGAPVGAHVKHPALPDTYVKRPDGQWESRRGGWKPAARMAAGGSWLVVDGPITYDDRPVNG